MSVELKNWKELCKEKDERIKELEGKFDLIVERLEEINYNDIQMVVSEVLEKYGFPKESVVQDEIWDELDGLCTSKYAIEIVKEVGGIE